MVSLEYLPLVGQDMKTCGGLGLQTLGLTGLSCIVKCALERREKEQHPVQTGVLYFLEHEGYFCSWFCFYYKKCFLECILLKKIF